MSKVTSIQTNYQPTLRQGQTKFAQNPSFGSNPAELPKETVDGIVDVLEKQSRGKIGWISEFLAKHDTELGKQGINAIFTATLAPIMIAFNPFSKMDDKTKQYTALRQPLSVITSLAGAVPLTVIIDNYISKLGSEGYLKGTLDIRMKPDKSYLGHDFDREYKEAQKSEETRKAFSNKYKPENLDPKKADNDGGFIQKLRYKAAIKEKYVEVKQAERKELFTKLIGENPNLISIDEETKQILLDGKEIGKNIPNITKKGELEAYLNENNLYKVSFRDFLKETFRFEFYEDNSVKPRALKSALNKVNAIEFLNKLGLKDFTAEELIRILNINHQSAKTVKKMDKIVKNEIYHDGMGAKEFVATMAQTTTENIGLHTGEDPKDMNLNHLFKRLGYITEENGTADFEKLMDKKITDILKLLRIKPAKSENPEESEKFSLSGLVRKDKKANSLSPVFPENDTMEKIISNFSKDIMEAKIGRVDKHFKAFKGYFGIASNLVIVAITCTALNWIYPRFIKKFFPSLHKHNEQAPEGGNK